MRQKWVTRLVPFFIGMALMTPYLSYAETITTTGVGTVAVTNDDFASATVLIFLAVEGEGADASSAIAQATAKTSAIRVALEKVGVAPSSFQLTSLSTYPHAEPDPANPQGPPKITGFSAYVSAQAVVVGLEKTGAAMNAAIAAGATQISTAVSGLSTPPAPGSVAAAVTEAIAQARTLAATAAENAKLRLGRLTAVEVKPFAGVSGGLTQAVLIPWSGWRFPFGGDGRGAVEVTTTYEAAP